MPRLYLCIILAVLTVGLMGCYSQVELNDMMVATGIGVDTHEEGVEVTLQVLNPSEVAGTSGKTSRPGVSTYTTTGETFFQALRRLTAIAPRKIFLGHIRIVIFGEDLSKQGIRYPLDFLMRDHEMRSDFSLLIAKGVTANEVLETLSPIEQIPANKIMNSLMSSEEFYGNSREIEIETFFKSYLSEGIEPIMTGVELVGDVEEGKKITSIEKTEPDTIIKINDMAIFKDDQLKGWLTEEESLGLSYLMNEIKNSIQVVKLEESIYSLEILKAETKITVKKPPHHFLVTTKIKASLGEGPTAMIQTETTLSDLKKKLEQRVETLMIQCNTRLMKEGTDSVGYGQVLYREAPRVFELEKENWEVIFQSLEMTYDVSVDLLYNGQITDDQDELGQ